MPKKGENIYKRKDGRWEGRYIKERSPSGKAVYGYVYGKSYGEVKTKREALIIEQKLMPEKSCECKEKHSFGDIAEQWFASLEPFVKQSTANKYRNILNLYISPEIKKTSVQKITHNMIQKHCNNLLLEGGKKKTGLAPKTVTDILSVIREVLHYAMRQGIEVSYNTDAVKIKQTVKHMRVLSRHEQTVLCNELYSDLNGSNIGILISLFTGLRIGEVCALNWEDVSLENQIMHVRHTMQRIQTRKASGKKTEVVLTTPKSACSIRIIPIPDELVRILKIYKKTDTGYILTNSQKRFMEPRTLQNHYKRILTQCSIDDTNFHTLRNTFATRCVELGFDVKSLSEILGHASVTITMNRYVHPSMELKNENMQRLSALLTVSPNSQKTLEVSDFG